MTHLSYSVSQIVGIVKGRLYPSECNDPQISELLIDSRQLVIPEQTVFFALVSRRNDGHKYIQELYQKDVRVFVVSTELPEYETMKDACFILVNDTIQAMQQLVIHHRRRFSLPVIGITGSNGKTIVKEWLFQLMHEDRKIVRNPKSYNSQIGVPLSVWQINEDDQLGIFEAGISEPDEMSKLQPVIQPSIGIFTNIGQAHAENFINFDQKIGEKLKLFTRVEVLVYCTDHLDIQQRIVTTEAFRKINFFTWGKKKENDLWIKLITRNGRWTDIQGEYRGGLHSIRIPFADHASVENAIHCWATLLYLNYDPVVIEERMARLTSIAMRMELKEGINNCSIINDSYSSDINSLNIALDFLNQQHQHKRKTVILSDLLQSGRNENELYAWIAELLFNKNVDQVIGIGPAISRHAGKFRMQKSFFPTTGDFLKRFPFSSFHSESILIKGARMFSFEEIVKALQQKAHETVLEINLNALVNNLNLIRSRLKPGVKSMVMVKAFSYGSGSYEIANILQFHNVDFLAVAYADEGVELRKAGIELPIMVMNPDEESMDSLAKYQLEPEVYSFRLLDLLEESRQKVFTEQNLPVPIHIKLDTGMYRLGFMEKDLDALVDRLHASPYLKVRSVFSHLVASHDQAHDLFTLQQIERFTSMTELITKALPYPVLRHILNSSGICRFPEAQFDMVRLGINLYGVPSCDMDMGRLQNVSTLKSCISQIKNVKAGDSVGYNRSWCATQDTTVAIIPIGYADGLSRRLSNGKGHILVKDQQRPIIGDVCMDMCMVDINDLEVKEGDPVIIFGEKFPITHLAEELETIPYEVLTNISRRVKRVYFQE
ncbi:MAG: bifunctional UDP-N-acetylmuramoyl-tripeptide:D-alanyl-D-alanine ligase/alanine racemase [Bacteroidetes bacterium]|nr:bifunctional UDP-N-acetylmuramoyl-tripeptide:D-alanyl-D-alanine ligase/alanine racemase [Bacteroidota bacterium]